MFPPGSLVSVHSGKHPLCHDAQLHSMGSHIGQCLLLTPTVWGNWRRRGFLGWGAAGGDGVCEGLVFWLGWHDGSVPKERAYPWLVTQNDRTLITWSPGMWTFLGRDSAVVTQQREPFKITFKKTSYAPGPLSGCEPY